MNKELQKLVAEIDQKLEAHKSRLQGLATELQSAKAYIQQSEPELLSLVGAVKELEAMKASIIKIEGGGIEPNKPNNSNKMPDPKEANQKPDVDLKNEVKKGGKVN